ncbi:MAG: phage tail protein [Sinomicrobium sp.]|nr:phage tail protein [Sinomicrobium sp.]
MAGNDYSIYPPVSFYFLVKFQGSEGISDYKFQEVDGISTEISTEEIKEGGENRFAYQVPVRPKYNNIELKRGLIPSGSALAKWCKNTLTGGFSDKIAPQTLLVSLLDEDGNAIISWQINDAWPVSWSVSKFNAQENSIAIESIKLTYTYFTTN